ncbi:MAG: hypothetical protein Ct9H300mP24_0250 [Candidatus Neomarinimicrobiota bacterium]|nr:MAG: hypothetical protein Ct9H300mP24_0250 [Candidatus Neomarinimicrobiota bacterium]
MLISVVYSQQDMITSDPFPRWENDVIDLLEEVDKNNEYNSTNKNFVLKDIRQLTFDGDNGEAYFSKDASQLIFQSKRNGNECDKLYTISIEEATLKSFQYKMEHLHALIIHMIINLSFFPLLYMMELDVQKYINIQILVNIFGH